MQNNRPEQVAELLAANPQLAEARGPNGLRMIMNAIYQQKTEVVEALLAGGAWVSVFEGAALGRLEAVKEAFTEWPGWKDQYTADGFTALHLACYFGQEETAQYLIEQGADVNALAQNGTKLRPVHSAAANGNLAILRALLEAGAEVNVPQDSGFTPLHQAAHRDDEAMTELFLQHGADRQARTDSGQTPADIALADGHPQLANRLTVDSSG